MMDKARIYADLLKLDINISYQDVPTPSQIQSLIITCQEYQQKVEKHMLNISMELSTMENRLRIEQLNITRKRNDMLTNDESIRRLPSIKEREAAVDDQLEGEHKALIELENDVNSL